MALTVGTMLGPHKILNAVGTGGMGAVYRARDTRLDRIVAIKVMADALGGEDNEAILEREGRAVAALNHPHICALHDVGRERDTAYLVMEYVDGETLAARLARGPLPVQELVRYGIQIAEGLDHAHRRGVIHQDLKPGNVMLTKSGVKVLDFGLAALKGVLPRPPLPTGGDLIATMKLRLSSERTLLGTVQYMAPERLQGAEANAASDLFAFGAVLYEMATGRRAFDSASADGVIGAILREDPPAPRTIRADLPASVEWFILKALAKNPDERWHTAADMVQVLRWIARAKDDAPKPVSPRRVLPVAAAIVAGALLMLAVSSKLRPAPPGAPVLAFSILPPPGGGFTPTPSSVPTPQFAVSRDGRRLIFVAAVGHDSPQLWIRALDQLQSHPLAGTAGAEYPFWSPDGESIGFFANGSLKRLDLAGGPARVLASAANGRGAAWSRGGTIVFAPTTQGGLYRVPAAGGAGATPLTTINSTDHEASHRWPQFLPDDRHFLYFVQSTSREGHGIYVGDLQGAEPPKRVATSSLSAAYAAEHLLFVADDALMAVKFDWKAQTLEGEPIPVVARVAGSSNFYAALSASETGELVYSSSLARAELVWMDRLGRRLGSIGAPAEYVDFRLSPGNEQLAVAEVDAQGHRPDLRIIDLTRGTKSRITHDSATDASPVWSPDGREIVFRSNRGGIHDLYRRRANGAGDEALLLHSANAKYPTDWTPDGKAIVYHTDQPGTGSDLWLLNTDGTQAKPIVQTPFEDMQGQVSPDGAWLAYTSTETGGAEVYIRSLGDGASRWQVSANGGTDPRWRGDGQELFYVSGDARLTSVKFEHHQPSGPKPLFPIRVGPAGNPYLSNYDVTADGRRFLLKVPVDDVTSQPIHVLINWLKAVGVVESSRSAAQ